MTQTSNPFLDQFARMFNDAAGAAQGVRREAETFFKGQVERLVAGMDLVRREEFDVVRDMAVKAREENARLELKIAELEARLATHGPAETAESGTAKPAARRSSRAARPETGEAS